MRVVVVGAGIGGALLGWRLGRAGADVTVRAGPERPDATGVSGGLVRAFEPTPAGCRLAADSLAELRADPVLAGWARYRETGSVYAYVPGAGADVTALLAQVRRRLPGSASLVDGADLAGWHDLPAGTVAVRERHAGHLDPDALRRAVLADSGAATGRPLEAAELPGLLRAYDAVVLAAGRWTDRLLAAAGLPTAGLRTKTIQYALHPAGGWAPPAFVDDTSGLWGRAAAGGTVLLGVPSDRWDVDPDAVAADPELPRRAAALAARRFGVEVGPPVRVVAGADAYGDPPVLALRPVPGVPGLHTFAGGSGGAAKSALAASRLAAADLLAGPGNYRGEGAEMGMSTGADTPVEWC